MHSIIQEVVLHGVKPLKTRIRPHSDPTNGTAAHSLHSLNMDFACCSGFICDPVMEVTAIEPNVRKGNW